jgi:DNA-binding GntR family transcriptional regulator
LSERAATQIRELIVTLVLPPGAPINEKELMIRLGVGRTPVREALQALARERLVDVFPRRGMTVSPVNVGDLADLTEARLALESAAARVAAERTTQADREIIADLLRELDHAAGRQDEQALIELDRRIHRHVYACAHNPVIEATLNDYYVLALRIWHLALDRVVRLDRAVSEHRKLLRAIRDGHADQAEQTMKSHISGFDAAIRRAL